MLWKHRTPSSELDGLAGDFADTDDGNRDFLRH
jgi:hypothetical protein